MRFKKEAYISVFTFLTLISLFAFFYNYHKTFINKDSFENSIPGIFDFQANNFEEITLHGLDGNVDFYWNQLLNPESIDDSTQAKTKGKLRIPGTWNDYDDSKRRYIGFGYGTYRFKILLPEDDLYGLKIGELGCAYKIWVDGRLLEQTGTVGTSKQDMIPSWKRKQIYFQSKNKIIDVVLQVSNFNHRNGGANNILVFGKAKDIINLKNSLFGVEIFLTGILFILIVYHFILYFYLRKRTTYLLFSVLSFLLLIRLLTTGEELLSDIFPDVSWYLSIKLEYLSYMLAMPVLFYYTYQFFKDDMSHKIVNALMVIATAFSIFVVLMPTVIISFTPLIFQVIVMLSAFYLLYVLLKASLDKKGNALIFFISFFLYFFIIINDILFFNGLVSTGYLMPFGFFILAYLQSIILSRNVSLTFVRTEELSVKLENYNKELEATIETRTHFIVEQKNELQTQAESLKAANKRLIELDSYKESLTQMIIHDLKNPLNIILNFSKDERVVFAGTQMLNLVMNLLDVQRYENSTMKLNLENVSINSIIQKAIYQMNFLIVEKNIQLKFKLHNDFYVSIDEDIMNRVIVNILSNALKFTPTRGDIIIDLEQKGKYIEVCVTDSGPGIPDNQKDVIFEKFGQLVARKSGRLGSTGLGLTFCKMAVEAHNGQIDFKSELGKGSTFCILLPFVSLKEIENETGVEILRDINISKIKFTPADKEILNTILDELSESKIYEISKIKNLIAKIEPQQNKVISIWISELQNAIWNSDKDKFETLIGMIRA